MFDNAMNSLMSDYHALCDRISKGKVIIGELPEKSGEKYNSYVNQLNYLMVLQARANTCIDILNGSVVLIAERSGELVAARRVDDKAKRLIEEAQRLGGFITSLDIVNRPG